MNVTSTEKDLQQQLAEERTEIAHRRTLLAEERRKKPMADSPLSIYLNDHLGLIAGEIELARRVARENEGASLGAYLEGYRDDLKEQKDIIEKVLASLGERPSTIKQAVGWLAEKFGRLKPNDALIGYTNLARVLELEVLVSAASSRVLLWETLSRTHISENTALWKEQSLQQLAALREHHNQAVRLAFETSEV